MAEELVISKGKKKDQYQSIIPQIKAMIKGEPDAIANLANICAAVKEQFNRRWVRY
jgi:GAF domain-containing protein